MGGIDKHRLYLAMYDDSKAAGPGAPPQIHWALLLGPKHEDLWSMQKTNVRYHATNRTRTGRWEFERRAVECLRSPLMLGRIFLGKIEKDDAAAVDCLLADPRRIGGGSRWDCWDWVESALVDLLQKGLLQLQNKAGLKMSDLRKYGQSLSTEIAAAGLDIGYGMPFTMAYPGPGP
ncbi:hypothetical protein C8Q77DRAFT_113714 [Trametes polyzona]|nr:hypothetical protein C8Q77DRAFT_113714 [Trametes polyzona]